MKKIKWFAYLVGLGLLLSCFVVSIAKAEVPSTYTVQSGDSLSKISLKFYGNEMLWKEIHKLNPQIINADLIYIGQVISLDPKIKISSRSSPVPLPPKVYMRADVYDKLIRHMFKVNDMKYVPREDCEHWLTEFKKSLIDYNNANLHEQQLLANKVISYSRNLEFYYLLDGIFEACKNDPDYRMIALLTALAWQESHFNNVQGKHGEITQFQFLPSTVQSVLQLDDVGLQIASWDLLNDNTKSAKLAYEWLMVNGAAKRDTLKALRWYNHDPQYAQYVIWKYNKVISIIKS